MNLPDAVHAQMFGMAASTVSRVTAGTQANPNLERAIAAELDAVSSAKAAAAQRQGGGA